MVDKAEEEDLVEWLGDFARGGTLRASEFLKVVVVVYASNISIFCLIYFSKVFIHRLFFSAHSLIYWDGKQKI